LLFNFILPINCFLCYLFRTIWICNCSSFNLSCFTISIFSINNYIVLVTVLVDFDTPPNPPIDELLNELELNPPPNPFPPKPFEKKSSSPNIDENPLFPFLPKNEPKKSWSSLLSNPKSSKKCLKISSALWKLKLVPWLGASNP